MIRAVGVVVPAHDEEFLLPHALAALRVACRHPRLDGLSVDLVTVLDACSDASATLAVDAVEVNARNVGAARRAGFAELQRRTADLRPDEVWLATTDADTLVPPHWLASQLDLAAAGADAVVGTVRVVDWSEQPEPVRRAFAASYGAPGEDHPHVHGANLGLRADVYATVGGIPALPVAEDVALVGAVRAAGYAVVATGRISVVTSARRRGRLRGGFADHLAELECRTERDVASA